MGGSQSTAKGNMASAQMSMAQQEVEALTDMYSRMMDQCFKKCVNNYNEADLTKGESVCIERCVFKYLDVHTKAATRLSASGSAMQQ